MRQPLSVTVCKDFQADSVNAQGDLHPIPMHIEEDAEQNYRFLFKLVKSVRD